MTSSPPPPAVRLLVAEDDPALLEMALMILDRPGYTVVSGADGAHALEVSRSVDHIDVLFTDILMPGHDGLHLASVLAAEHPGLRVVFTTAFASAAVTAAVASSGCELLPKPYTAPGARRAVDNARPIRPGFDPSSVVR